MKKIFFFISIMLLACSGLYAERVTVQGKFSIDLPDGWQMKGQYPNYKLVKGEKSALLQVLDAPVMEKYEQNDVYFKIKKPTQEGESNIRAKRKLWLMLYKGYVYRTYEKNNTAYFETYKIYPKQLFVITAISREPDNELIEMSRSILPEPWRLGKQLSVFWFGLGWKMAILFILFAFLGYGVGGVFTRICWESNAKLFAILIILAAIAIPLLFIGSPYIAGGTGTIGFICFIIGMIVGK